jgi:hypothetical protein
VRQAEIDSDQRAGTTSEESAELRKLRQEVKEPCRANEILKAVSDSSRPSWTGLRLARRFIDASEDRFGWPQPCLHLGSVVSGQIRPQRRQHGSSNPAPNRDRIHDRQDSVLGVDLDDVALGIADEQRTVAPFGQVGRFPEYGYALRDHAANLGVALWVRDGGQLRAGQQLRQV